MPADATAPKATPTLPVASDLSPAETAERLVQWGAAKAKLPLERMVVLGIMAGFFVALGAALFTGVMVEASLSHGPSRVLGGVCFSIGLLLIAMTGSELSTGNCLMLTAACQGEVHGRDLVRVLAISFAANVVGALILVLLMVGTGLTAAAYGRVAERIATAKLAIPPVEAFVRAILCNILVAVAVWLILATRTLIPKLVGLAFPITAFVALGFEHSIANMFLIPMGLVAGTTAPASVIAVNFAAVTLGNLVGGLLAALTVWLAYLQPVASRGQAGGSQAVRSEPAERTVRMAHAT